MWLSEWFCVLMKKQGGASLSVCSTILSASFHPKCSSVHSKQTTLATLNQHCVVSIHFKKAFTYIWKCYKSLLWVCRQPLVRRLTWSLSIELTAVGRVFLCLGKDWQKAIVPLRINDTTDTGVYLPESHDHECCLCLSMWYKECVWG